MESTSDNFVIVLPPPNVTGSLHLGHALTGAIQVQGFAFSTDCSSICKTGYQTNTGPCVKSCEQKYNSKPSSLRGKILFLGISGEKIRREEHKAIASL